MKDEYGDLFRILLAIPLGSLFRGMMIKKYQQENMGPTVQILK